MTESRDMRACRSRVFHIEKRSVNEDGSVAISFSSETDMVERWFGIEVLSHAPGAMDMTRAKDGLPFLMDHGRCLIGRVRNITVGPDRKGRGDVYFSSSPEAQQVRQDMLDDIRPDISVGYDPMEDTTERGVGNAPDVITVTRWMPYEISSVMVPADTTVGVGRALKRDTDPPGVKVTVEVTPPAAEETPAPAAAEATALVPAEAPPEGGTPETAPGRSIPTSPAVPAGTTKEVRMSDTTKKGPDAAPVLTEEQARQKAIQDAMACRDIAGRLSLTDLADGMLREGKTVDAVFEAMLNRATSAPLPTAPGLQLSPKEARAYSYRKAILGSALEKEGNGKFDGLERELHIEIGKNLPEGYKARGGVFVPMQTRTGLDSGTSTAGAELKYTQYGGELIELLRNSAYVAKNGARVMSGLQGPISFPRQANSGTASWVGENPGSDLGITAAALSSVSLAPKSLMSASAYSRQLLQQAVIDVENFVRNDLAKVLGLAWDHAALHGGGSNEPVGIYQQANVNAYAMGGVPTFGKLQDMITAVANSNALDGSLGWLTTPSMAGKLAQTLVASAAGSKMIWEGTYQEGLVNGYKARATKQVSGVMTSSAETGGAEQGIIYGNWEEVLIGNWGALELLTDPYVLALQGMIRVIGFQMVDIAVRHPGSFCKSTGATLA